MIGGCFGHQIIPMALGGKSEKMPTNEKRPKILGRELINFNDEFYRQSWV